MTPEVVVVGVLVVLNAPLYLLLGKFFFGGWDGFVEAICFWIKPELFSLFEGEYLEDIWAELKLGIFLLICGVCVYGEFRLAWPYVAGLMAGNA